MACCVDRDKREIMRFEPEPTFSIVCNEPVWSRSEDCSILHRNETTFSLSFTLRCTTSGSLKSIFVGIYNRILEYTPHWLCYKETVATSRTCNISCTICTLFAQYFHNFSSICLRTPITEPGHERLTFNLSIGIPKPCATRYLVIQPSRHNPPPTIPSRQGLRFTRLHPVHSARDEMRCSPQSLRSTNRPSENLRREQ